MKKGLNNKFFAVALMAIMSFSFTSTVMAADGPAPTAVNLKFIGKMEERPVFQLNLANQSDYTVVVKGAYGDVLYKDNLAGEIGYKKFLLNTEAIDDTFLRFEVTSRKTNETSVFEINLNAKDADKMVVTK